MAKRPGAGSKSGLRALSIQQPWIHAILHCGKEIENRSWRTHHRGWIALHASAARDKCFFYPRGVKEPDLDDLDYSAICGVARLVDVVTEHRSKWFNTPDPWSVNYGWVLEDVRVLKQPIPCKGTLGLWLVPPKIVREIRRQLPRLDFGVPRS